MDKIKVANEALLALAAEMVLDEALLRFRSDKIYQAIDHALAAGDKEQFQRLTEELKLLRE